MPSKSHKQRRYLEHKKGHKWVKQHHFDKVKPGRRKSK
jgi:hypothetical protein